MSAYDPTSIVLTIVVVVAIIALVCYLVQHPPVETEEEGFRCCGGRRASSRTVRKCASALAAVPSTAADGPAPVDYLMGEYDGIPLKTECSDCWRHAPCGPALVSSTQNHTTLGNQLPLRTLPTANDFPNAPTVDGTPNAPRDMFVFAHNQTSPLCCPSTYSTSTGCVCTTPEQRAFIVRRGTNNSAPGNVY